LVEKIHSEPELSLGQRILAVTSFHVFVDLADWHNEVKGKFINYIGDHTDEYGKGSVFEVRQLNVDRAEFYSPSDFGVARRWGLEPHSVPVG